MAQANRSTGRTVLLAALFSSISVVAPDDEVQQCGGDDSVSGVTLEAGEVVNLHVGEAACPVKENVPGDYTLRYDDAIVAIVRYEHDQA
jgi:hypothetical protein